MTTWQQELVAELGRLGPDIGCRVLIAAPSSAQVVPGRRFHDRTFLDHSIRDCGASLFGAMGGEDAGPADVRPAVAASRFTRHYVSSLTTAALVGLAHGVGLDLSAERCAKVVDDGIPRQHLVGPDDVARACRERPTTWPVAGSPIPTTQELREYVWRRLYAEHLAPLFVTVTDLTGASPHLLWSNAAEWVAYVAELAAEHLSPVEAAPFLTEADVLLDAEALPGINGANPLRGLVEWVEVDASDFPRGVQTRRHCCITYLLPARLGRLCANCPFLPVPDRVALWRETRADGRVRGGPAERRSIEIGLRKIRRPSPR